MVRATGNIEKLVSVLVPAGFSHLVASPAGLDTLCVVDQEWRVPPA
jgi:hypothetical protein